MNESSKSILFEIERHVKENPDALALALLASNKEDFLVSREKMWKEIGRFQSFFLSQNIPPQTVLPIILGNSLELWAAFYGAIAANLIPTILAVPSFKTRFETYAQNLLALLARCDSRWICSNSQLIQKVEPVLGKTDLHPILLSVQEANSSLPLKNPSLISPNSKDVAFLQHSSGSTGLQKGVALDHAMTLEHVKHYARQINLVSEDVIVSWLPLYHDMGLIACCIQPLLCGVPTIEMSPFDWVIHPDLLWKAISNHRGTLAWLPNFAYQLLADRVSDKQMENIKLNSLRMLINCSEPVYASSHRHFLNRYEKYGISATKLSTCYAMAENVFSVSQCLPGKIPKQISVQAKSLEPGKKIHLSPPEENGARMVMSSGPLVDFVDAKIVGKDRKSLPAEHIGEIAIRGPCLFKEYYKNEEATSKVKTKDGYFLTGDLGFIAENELFVTGRVKDLLIVRGQNYYPNDIEAIANSVNGVKPGRVVAFGVSNEELGTEEVVLLAKTEDIGIPSRVSKIQNDLKARVAEQLDCILDQVRIVPKNSLVKTTSGKMARSKKPGILFTRPVWM